MKVERWEWASVSEGVHTFTNLLKYRIFRGYIRDIFYFISYNTLIKIITTNTICKHQHQWRDLFRKVTPTIEFFWKISTWSRTSTSSSLCSSPISRTYTTISPTRATKKPRESTRSSLQKYVTLISYVSEFNRNVCLLVRKPARDPEWEVLQNPRREWRQLHRPERVHPRHVQGLLFKIGIEDKARFRHVSLFLSC